MNVQGDFHLTINQSNWSKVMLISPESTLIYHRAWSAANDSAMYGLQEYIENCCVDGGLLGTGVPVYFTVKECIKVIFNNQGSEGRRCATEWLEALGGDLGCSEKYWGKHGTAQGWLDHFFPVNLAAQ